MRKITRKGLHKKLWLLQGKKIKSEQVNFQGYVECYTCNTMILVQESNIGHYWHNKLDFDRRNLKIQCVRCNHWLGGNLGRYGAKLIKENGIEWYDQLERDAAQHKGYGFKELKEIAKLYEPLS